MAPSAAPVCAGGGRARGRHRKQASARTKAVGSAENREECLFRCDSAGLGASPPEQSELYKSHFGPGSIVKAVSSLSLLVFGDSGGLFFENGTKLSAPPVWSTCVSVPARQTGRPCPLCTLPADTRPQGCSAGFQRPAILPGSPTAWPVHGQVSPSTSQDPPCWKQPFGVEKGQVRCLLSGPAQMV